VTLHSVRKSSSSTPPSGAEYAVELRRSQTLVNICHAEIERMILAHELELGGRINELALAARLGISRGPVREACRTLTQAGLLENHANRGFFVRKLAHKDVIDLYDLRAGLMRLAGELIVQHITDESLARLRAFVDGMEAARRENDTARFQELNAGFHAALVEAADNRRLQEVYDGFVKEMRLFRQRGLASSSAMAASNQEHQTIIDAIATRDTALAAAAMADHILQGKARFLSAAGDDLDE
jgi:DNA-binding GntR family transcriptional regulator